MDVMYSLYFFFGICSGIVLFKWISGILFRTFHPFFLSSITLHIFITVMILKKLICPWFLVPISLVYPLFTFLLSKRNHNDHSQFYLNRRIGYISVIVVIIETILLANNQIRLALTVGMAIQVIFFSHNFIYYKNVKQHLTEKALMFWYSCLSIHSVIIFFITASIFNDKWNTTYFLLGCSFIAIQGLMIIYFYLKSYYIFIESQDSKSVSLYRKNLSVLSANKTLSQRILAVENKALNNQVNPHFLFNAMNSISSLVIRDKKEEASQYLDTLSGFLSSSFGGMETSFISLKEELELLQSYVSLENLRRDSPISFETTLTPFLDVNSIYIPIFFLQVFFENSIWHGIHSHSNGIISLEINVVDSSVQFTITDNGSGLSGSESNKNHVSQGIELVRDRLLTLQAHFKQDTFLNISDLKYVSGPKKFESGTQVKITIPLINKPPLFRSSTENQA